MEKGKQRAGSPSPSAGIDSEAEVDFGMEVPDLRGVNGGKSEDVNSWRKMSKLEKRRKLEELERLWWNGVMSEPLYEPRNEYARAFPYHPLSGRVGSEPGENGARRRGEQQMELEVGEDHLHTLNEGEGNKKQSKEPMDGNRSDSSQKIRETSDSRTCLNNGDVNSFRPDEFKGIGVFRQVPAPTDPPCVVPEKSKSVETANTSHGISDHFLGTREPRSRKNDRLPNPANHINSRDHMVEGMHIVYSRNRHSIVSEVASLVDGESTSTHHSATAPTTPPTPTWKLTLSSILNSRNIPSRKLKRLEHRLSNPNLHHSSDPKIDRGRFASAEDLGLVPNFSNPIGSSSFSDRYALLDPKREGSSLTPPSYLLRSASLPNGTASSSTTSSLACGRRGHKHCHCVPSGLPNGNENRGFTLFSSYSTPTPPASPEIQIRQHEGTIATQAKLIRKLHRTIDTLRERNQELEDHVIPELTDWIERQSIDLDDNEEMVKKLREEIVDLKIAVDFGNKVLGGCYVREWELWKFVRELKMSIVGRKVGWIRRMFGWKYRRQEDEREVELEEGSLPDGYEYEVFAHGPDPPGSERLTEYLRSDERHGRSRAMEDDTGEMGAESRVSATTLSGTEVEVILETAAQNVQILKQDVEEMVQLVQGCKWRAIGFR